MGKGKGCSRPDAESMRSVLKDTQDQASCIFEFCKQEKVKVFVRFILFLILRMKETDRLPAV